ncbi:MAG: hydroxyacid dehydrogenase [Candidatus Uhrbacteria bacterium]|nr:hydroxyacid dehydrogenase [Candidatus Uhrbacteria bacterium]
MRIYIAFSNWQNHELLDALREKAEVVIAKKKTIQSEFADIVREYDGVIIGRLQTIDKEVLDIAPLKFVGLVAKGTNNIDVEECRRKNVAVFYTPEANISSVAEHVMALILSLSKNIVNLDRSVREEQFDIYRLSTIDIKGKVLGIIGAGPIAKEVIQRARAFGMSIECYTQHPENHQDIDTQFVSLEDLLKNADFVSVNIPLVDSTRNLIDREQLALMKKTSFVINTARGGIVNERALVEALKNHIIAGAGLDVFEEEPTHNKELFGLDNVILTPHVAGVSKEALQRMEEHVIHDIVSFLENKESKYRLV